MEAMKLHGDSLEGPETWTRFKAPVDNAISVPRSVIEQREG